MADISYTPSFRHTNWFNNVDRVDAEGPNGFNIRFNALQSDLQNLSTVVGQIDAELDRLGSPPPPVQQTLTIPPVLASQRGSAPWLAGLDGSAFPEPGKAADGVQNVLLPNGVRLLSLHVIGFTAGNVLGISLVRARIGAPGQDFLAGGQITRGAQDRFDATFTVDDPSVARVDLNAFRYAIRATATAIPSPDVATAEIDAFRLIHIAN